VTRLSSRRISTQRTNQLPFYKSKAFSAAKELFSELPWAIGFLTVFATPPSPLTIFTISTMDRLNGKAKPLSHSISKMPLNSYGENKAPTNAQWVVAFNDRILSDVLAIPFVKITL
jgi:hypothetical protein